MGNQVIWSWTGLWIWYSTGAYTAGSYGSNPLSVYNSNGTLFGTLTNSRSTDVFLVKYDTDKNVDWMTRIGRGGADDGYSITMNNLGIYVTGRYFGALSIYNSNGTVFGSLANTGGFNTFIVKYSITSSALAQLANSTKVQRKVISSLSLNGLTATVNLSNLKLNGVNYNSITFDNDADTIELAWNGSYWFVISNSGTILS